MYMNSWWNKLKSEVIEEGLCTRCGTCVGICSSQAIEFYDPLGECIPRLKKSSNCDNEWIYYACPGKYVSFPELNNFVFGRQPQNKMLGNFQKLYVGYAVDPVIRHSGASGGIISATLIYLLETHRIDGAIVLGTSETEPWQSEPKIVDTREKIIEAAQSKYTIAPLNTVLSQLKDIDGRLAYVGLPCQVHSIRKLQMRNFSPTRKIKYIIGSFCGNTLHFSSVISFLKNYGIYNYHEVVSLKYRAGDWPGKMEVVLKNGLTLGLEKFYANYLIPFHILKRCLLCTDLTNEFADISGGDAWAPNYEEQGEGFSLIVGRTLSGGNLIRSMVAEGVLNVKEINEEEAMLMHSHGYDFKKRGAFIRMNFRKKRAKSIPDYGYDLGPFSFRRELFERLLGMLFGICSWKISRRIIEIVPPRLMGMSFNKARIFWKKLTRRIKQSGLEKFNRS
jgi:coenzyme F420 hydrogenase subunit beta